MISANPALSTSVGPAASLGLSDITAPSHRNNCPMEVSLGVKDRAELQITLIWSYFALLKPISGAGSYSQGMPQWENHLIQTTQATKETQVIMQNATERQGILHFTGSEEKKKPDYSL